MDTGIEDEPILRAWMQEPVSRRRATLERPGRWVAEPSWPSPDVEERRLALGDGTLAEAPRRRRPPARDRHRPPLRPRRRRLVRGRHPRRGRGRPARRRRPRALLHLRPARGADRAARQRARGARAGERPAGRAARRAPLRRGARRHVAARDARGAEPHPPRAATSTRSRSSRERPTRVVLELDGIAQAIPAGHRAPARALARVLAVAVAGARAGHARHPHRGQLAGAAGARAAPRGRASCARSRSPSRRPPLEVEKLEPGRGLAHGRRATSPRAAPS